MNVSSQTYQVPASTKVGKAMCGDNFWYVNSNRDLGVNESTKSKEKKDIQLIKYLNTCNL